MATANPTQSPRGPSVRPLRFNVDDYYRLAEVGILARDVRSELIEGEVFLKVASTPGSESRGPSVARLRFSVDDYYRLAEVGILARDVRSELIEGEVYLMSPIGSPHAACVDRLNMNFAARLGAGAIVRIQGPFEIDDHSEPEPDLLLLRPRPDFYRANHPGPADVLLLVEVMDSSVDHDRNVKLPLYAQSGVSEVWLVDLPGDRIEVHRRPEGGQYAENSIVTRGQALAPEAFPDLELAVDAILG